MKFCGAVLALVLAILVVGCASAGGPRHIAVVSVVTAHSTLAAVQDTEALLVCGTATALPAPQCITPEAHRAFAKKLVTAFDLDGQIAKQVLAWPPDQALPPVITNLLSQLDAILAELIAALPNTPATDRLLASLKGAQ